jgi:RNA polymerase sigma-70 factor (ECF subfamily)
VVVYARCQQLLRDEAEAEDATQETFLRVHRHLARVADGDDALRWIYRVATNYCLNEIRNRKRRPAPVEALPERAVALAGEERIADRDLLSRLMERMPAKVRPAAWLYHVDGFEQEEVARILGVSRRTVASRLATFGAKTRKFLAAAGAAGR